MAKTKTRAIPQYQHLTKIIVVGLIFLALLIATAFVVRLTLPKDTNSITAPPPQTQSNPSTDNLVAD